jgi:hypothetical protein
MIIFGSKATPVSSETIQFNCSSCNTPNSVQMTVFQKYSDIFWIPVFPIGKTGMTQCTHCKQVLEKKEFNPFLRSSYEMVKAKSKTPLWTFSGLVLLVALFILGGITSNRNAEQNAQFIAAPQRGDVYEIKLDNKQYTLYKVENIVGDTVFVLAHEYESNKRRGLSDLKKRGDLAYFPEPFSILKSDLEAMLESNEILDIDRK